MTTTWAPPATSDDPNHHGSHPAPSTSDPYPVATAPAPADHKIMTIVGVGIGCVALIALVAFVSILYVRRRDQRRPLAGDRSPLLAGAGGGGGNGAMSARAGGAIGGAVTSSRNDTGHGALAGLKDCRVIKKLRDDPIRGIEVLVVDRKRRRVAATTDYGATGSTAASMLGTARGEYERVVLKRVTCFNGRERARAVQEYNLLQRVWTEQKCKGITRPMEYAMVEAYASSSISARPRPSHDPLAAIITASPAAAAPASVNSANASATPVGMRGAINASIASTTHAGGQASYSVRNFELPYVVTIVFPYYAAGDLEEYVETFAEARQRVPEHVVLAVAHQVASTLVVLHSRMRPFPILHGDIKPSNLLLDVADPPSSSLTAPQAGAGSPRPAADGDATASRTTRVLLGDFGSAREITPQATTGGSMTHRYAAPECFQTRAPCTSAIDMWALGITMLHLMLGRAPERTLGVVALEEEDTTTDGTESVHTTRSRASTTTTPPAATSCRRRRRRGLWFTDGPLQLRRRGRRRGKLAPLADAHLRAGASRGGGARLQRAGHRAGLLVAGPAPSGAPERTGAPRRLALPTWR
jgi:hypothetical protein